MNVEQQKNIKRFLLALQIHGDIQYIRDHTGEPGSRKYESHFVVLLRFFYMIWSIRRILLSIYTCIDILAMCQAIPGVVTSPSALMALLRSSKGTIHGVTQEYEERIREAHLEEEAKYDERFPSINSLANR